MRCLILACLCLSFVGVACAGSFTLTREGQPAAAIILSTNPTPSAAFAASELQYHVRKMTGALLPVLTEDQPVKGPRILVGESVATQKLGLRGRRYRPEEHVIKFLPDTLVLLGRDTEAAESATDPKTVEGKFGKAQQFSGNQIIEVTADFSDDCGTMEAWVWLPAEKPERPATILRLDGVSPWTYHIIQRDANSSRISYTTYDGSKGHSRVSGDLAEGWHHVAGTHDLKSGKMELFVDGKSCGSTDYIKTTCRGTKIGVGGTPNRGASVGNPFIGLIDEVRITSDVRAPQTSAAQYEADANTLALLHMEHAGSIITNAGSDGYVAPTPRLFDSNGTVYAVYDFLERYCNVRWYLPGELGEIIPKKATLTVSGPDLQRKPAMSYRWIAGSWLYMPTFPEHVSSTDQQKWMLRNRLGGDYKTTGHSFYGYYDRFLKDHPEWFAQGYTGKPPQMCYTNPEFIAQVVQDARDYFDGKGSKSGAAASSNIFGLVPMDNSSWCKCEACQAELNPAEKDNPQFNNGWASDYIFNFTNTVAREVAKTHPDKLIGQLAYSTYAYCPTKVNPEKNVSVQMCLHTRNWWCPSMEVNDLKLLTDWRKTNPERPLHLWLYYCFPALNAKYGNFNYWPGFFAHTVVKQMKLYHDANINGIFLENSSEMDATYLMDQLEYYVTFKLADDPTLDGNKLIEEFFTRYYGSAAGPMKALYTRIEDLFSNPKYYPPEIQKSAEHQHQTEELAWKWIGTPERVAQLQKLMDQAKAAAKTPEEQQRVALFEKGIWLPISEGPKKYEAHQTAQQAPLRTLAVPRVPEASGDAAKVDWSQLKDLGGWGGLRGDPTSLKFETRMAHDGKFVYLQLVQLVDPKTLRNGSEVHNGDDWELFFAAERGGSYRQICVAPNGKTYEAGYKPAAEWKSGVVVSSDTSKTDRWTTNLCFPIANLTPKAAAEKKFYGNFYRNGSGAAALLAWSPPHASSFHETARMVEFDLK
ncbi:MAG: DUF4838 domain-containing protein [Armatimonadota bacterium]